MTVATHTAPHTAMEKQRAGSRADADGAADWPEVVGRPITQSGTRQGTATTSFLPAATPKSGTASVKSGTGFDAVLVRAHLNGLKALIDTQAAQIAALQSQLNTAIANTSSNTNAVATLGLVINNNPPQNSDVQPLADKLDELINTLRH